MNGKPSIILFFGSILPPHERLGRLVEGDVNVPCRYVLLQVEQGRPVAHFASRALQLDSQETIEKLQKEIHDVPPS